ncbi:MAG TPA: TetR family transcriptional regulator [Streptosporangiaceae bacterium]|jgi:AcrR family transcriptional regulator|nr:TetR family transcriptional regulator [Streptosporangiaceae bacterium]
MMGVAVPYESTGRRAQKTRTRTALVSAARALLAQGAAPTVEAAAAAAGISRTTAYRYFPNQRALVTAAHPEIDQASLLPADAPKDPAARLEVLMRALTRLTLEWEPQLRASLRLSLEPARDGKQPMLRQGRAVGWIEEALAPLHAARPDIDTRGLAVAIRSATGIESLIWLIDIAGLSRPEAAELMRRSAQALLQAALHDLPADPA